MGRYFETIEDTVKRDELFGGMSGKQVVIRNVTVAEDAEIKRGMILAADKTFGTYHLATASDVDKVLAVARDNFKASEGNVVTSAYTSGVFNRERLILAEGADIDDFEESLRKVDIHLTSIVNLNEVTP